MGKSDVTMKFDANTGVFVRDILKAREALENSAKTARKFGEETSMAGSQASAGMSRAAETARGSASIISGAMSGISGAIGGMGGVISTVTQITNAFFSDLSAKAEKARRDLQSLAQIQAGGAAQGMTFDEFNKKISVIGGGLVTPEKSRELVKSAYQLGPKFSDNEKEAAASAGAKYSYAYRGGKTAEQEAAFQKNFAEIARASKTSGSNLPSDQAGIEGLSDFMAQHGGLENEEDVREFNESPDKKAALARIVAKNLSEESKRGYKAIQKAVIEGREASTNKKFLHKMHHPRLLDEEEKRKARLVELSKSGNLNEEAILSDPTLVDPENQRAISAFAAEYNPDAIDEAAGGDAFRGRIGETGKFFNLDNHGKELAAERRNAIVKESLDQKNSAKAMAAKNEQDEFDNKVRGAGVENSYVRGTIDQAQKVRQVSDELDSSLLGQISNPLNNPYTGGPIIKALLNQFTIHHEETKDQRQDHHDEHMEALREFGLTRQNPTLRNDKEGQR